MAEKNSGGTNKGHADEGMAKQNFSKGENQQIGSAIPLAEKPFSVNQKTGGDGSGE